jgi:hypothetical protein
MNPCGKAMTFAGDTPLVTGQPVSPVAAARHWVTANASVDAEFRYPTGPLQLTAVDLPQRRLVDGTRQRSRGAPSSSSRDESSGRVENRFIVLGIDKRGLDRQFGESPLLMCEHARVHATGVVEGQCGERALHHAVRNAADQFDDQTGHTNALPREKRDGMASRIPKHPDKRRVRETIKCTVLSDEKST